MKTLKHGNNIIKEASFSDNTTNEEILEWVKNKFVQKNHIVFDNNNLWEIHPTDTNKIIHETMVSYTELDIIESPKESE